jgi:glutaredoxin
MIIVYGADWCEDTKRSRRHLRRLAVAHHYVNIDEDLDGLERALGLNNGRRRTPIIDLGLQGATLVEPDNDTLAGALVELEMLTQEDVHERMGVQNVGDVVTLTGVTGWCPAYYSAGVTSLGGPGDRPDETMRGRWLARREGQPVAIEEPAQ